MARDVFPFRADRNLVREFLHQTKRKGDGSGVIGHTGSTLEIKPGHILQIAGGPTVAWVAPTDGALYGKLLDGAQYHPGVRLLHFILTELGQPERRIVREDRIKEQGSLNAYTSTPNLPPGQGLDQYIARWTYFIDDAPTDIDAPILLCGPLGMAAYRVSPPVVEGA